jgi:hypothetical protein
MWHILLLSDEPHRLEDGDHELNQSSARLIRPGRICFIFQMSPFILQLRSRVPRAVVEARLAQTTLR